MAGSVSRGVDQGLGGQVGGQGGEPVWLADREPKQSPGTDGHSRALLDAASAVVNECGAGNASTREIYARAGVKAPTLYHHFGDKRGLMDAMVTDAFERYLEQKRTRRSSGDPATDIRRGWDAHVAFARENPAVYQLMFPAGAPPSAAASDSIALLRDAFERIARAGQLRDGVTPEHATRTLSAALHGVTAAICAEPTKRGNARLSVTVRDAITYALLNPPPDGDP
jgi:AcrR family transcriptional regulator